MNLISNTRRIGKSNVYNDGMVWYSLLLALANSARMGKGGMIRNFEELIKVVRRSCSKEEMTCNVTMGCGG